MPLISPESFRTGLSRREFQPLYLLFGEEEFLVDEALDDLIGATVDASTASFNFDQLQGSETTLNEIVERASAYPLMAERRVVVVREIDRTFALRGRPAAGSSFARYMASPSPTTVLIMTAPGAEVLGKGKSNAPKAPYDLIVPGGAAVRYPKVYERELGSWVTGRLKARGREIAPDALELFINYAGESLRLLHNEIEKLLTFVEARPKITREDVRMTVGAGRAHTIFELQRAVGARSAETAVAACEGMLRAGESEQLILTMLARYFTILWRLSELRTRTRDKNEMARAVGISSFFLPEYLAALDRYGPADLRLAFEALLSADVAIKTGKGEPHIVLQLAILAVVRGDARAVMTEL